jgi:GDP-mannose transporter
MFMFAKMGGEFERLHAMMDSYDASSYLGFLGKLPKESLALMVLGCLIGTGIGYSGWWCRGKVSATSFTLIGVLNKCITVLVNLMIWDQHASAVGIACLFLCLIGGAFYEQAPMRKRDGDSEMKANAEKDVEIAVSSKHSNTPNGGGGLTKRGGDSDDETAMTKPLI